MSRMSSKVNVTLTNYAQGIAQDRRSAIADFLAPVVNVPASMGQYKEFNEKNQFVLYKTERAIGGPATRIKFEADDPTYNCKPQALEIAIDDAERDAAGEGDPLGLEQAKIDTLLTSTTLAREEKVSAVLKAGLSAVDGIGVWSNAANDPVKEIDDVIMAIAIATGTMPNAIAFGLGAWNIFRNHPMVIKRQPGAALIGLTTGQAVQMLLNPAIEVRVGIMSKDTTKWGNTKSASNIIGAEVYVFHRSVTPTLFDPSMAKTFMAGVSGVSAVREYRDDSCRSDIYAIDYSEDIKLTSSACGSRITIS